MYSRLLDCSGSAFNTLIKNESENSGSINNLLLGTWAAISTAITFISDHRNEGFIIKF